MLLLVSPVSAAAHSKTQVINLTGRTALAVGINEDQDTLSLLAVGDLTIKLPGQKAQLVKGLIGLEIDLSTQQIDYAVVSSLEDYGAIFEWSMSKSTLSVQIGLDETGTVIWTAAQPPVATHTSINLGEILGIPGLNLVIRINAVETVANVEADPQSSFNLFGLIGVGTLNIVFTPPSLD